MQIAGRKIADGEPPYIVAEASCNHAGSLENALLLIQAAKKAGADAVKFQCYTPDTITLNHDSPEFIVKDGPWKGRRLYELYQKAQTPFEWFPWLFEQGKRYGITVFSSVFDPSSIILLEKLDCPAYKIASMEITDTPLIARAAKTGKPLIISTGMASDGEIFDAQDIIDSGNTAFLHCISAYPAQISESDLSELKAWIHIDCDYPSWGVSDHTMGWEIPVAVTVLGASIIEKHLTLSRDMDTEDREFSLIPAEFEQMCRAVRDIHRAMQPAKSSKSEDSSRQMRRSLYAVKDIHRGDKFTHENIRSIRPSYGLPPRDLPEILDKTAACDIQYGSALKWEMVDQ